MFTMPAITRVACIAILIGCMLAAAAVFLGDLATAVNTLIACVMLLAGTIALNL